MPLLLEWGKKWILSCGCVYLSCILDVVIVIVTIFLNNVFVVVMV